MRDVITLRARYHRVAPFAGMLMRSKGGKRVYSVLFAKKLGRSGDPKGFFYRLTCVGLRKAEVPEGATIYPWLGANNPRRPKSEAAAPRPAPDPEAVKARVRRARVESERAQVARASRIGRDHGVTNRRDHGHGILQKPVCDRSGRVLRDPLVVIEDAPDPEEPRRRIRRARRADPLHALLRARSISARQFEAAERLRDDMQNAEPSMPGSTLGEIYVDVSSVGGIRAGQLSAWRSVRRALTGMDEQQRAVLLWIVVGRGTIEGFASHARVRRSSVPELLREALTVLADFYFGPYQRRAQRTEIRACQLV